MRICSRCICSNCGDTRSQCAPKLSDHATALCMHLLFVMARGFLVVVEKETS